MTSPSEPRVEPCPWCGYSPVAWTYRPEKQHQALCGACRAAGPVKDNKDDSLSAWNSVAALRRRADDLELMLRFVLENVGVARDVLRRAIHAPVTDSGNLPILDDAAREALRS